MSAIAGEEIGEGVSTWRSAVATAAAMIAHQVSSQTEGERERTAAGAGGEGEAGGEG